MQNPISRVQTFFVRLQSADTTNGPVLDSRVLELQLDDGQMALPLDIPFMLELPNEFEEVVIRWQAGNILAEVRRTTDVGVVNGADTPTNPLEFESFKSRQELVNGAGTPTNPLEFESFKSREELANDLAPLVSVSPASSAEAFTFHLDPDTVKENKRSQSEYLSTGIQKIEGMLMGVHQTLQKHSSQLDSLLIQSERCQSVDKKTVSRNSSAKPQTKTLVAIQDVLDSTAASSRPRIIKKIISPSPRVEAFSLTDSRTEKAQVTMSGLSSAFQRLNNIQVRHSPRQITANLSLNKSKGFGAGQLLVHSKHNFSAINKVLAGVRPRLKKSRRTPSQPIQPIQITYDPRYTYPGPGITDEAPGFHEHQDPHTLIQDLKGFTQEIQPIGNNDEGTASKQPPKHRESCILPEGAKKYQMMQKSKQLSHLSAK